MVEGAEVRELHAPASLLLSKWESDWCRIQTMTSYSHLLSPGIQTAEGLWHGGPPGWAPLPVM